MEKETTTVTGNTVSTPTLHTVHPRPDAPFRTMSMDEARRLMRKVSKDHEGLFRRLAK